MKCARAPPQVASNSVPCAVIRRVAFIIESAPFCGRFISSSVAGALRLMKLFVANMIKWPPAVHYYTRIVVDVSWEDLIAWSSNKANMLSIIMSVVEWCDGTSTWPTVFKRMNSGLMDATTGLLVQMTYLGVLLKPGRA